MNYYMNFANMATAAIFKMEMEGQISDGKYENTRPQNHWHWVTKKYEYHINEDDLGGDYPYRRLWSYNLREWVGYIKKADNGETSWEWARRVIYYAQFANVLSENDLTTMMEEADYLRGLIETLGFYIKDHGTDAYKWDAFIDYVKSTRAWYINDLSKATLFTKKNADKFVAATGTYTLKDLRSDLLLMSETVNTQIYK